MTDQPTGTVRYPRIRLALINIGKEAQRTSPSDPEFKSNITTLKTRLEAVTAHLETLIDEAGE